MSVRPAQQPSELFHPVIWRWFGSRFGEPTEAQRLAWPAIATGEHVLVTAPTGSGKTLTAFLWAIDRLVQGSWEGGAVRVLYVSPLRALNNDIRRNLITPLTELSAAFSRAGLPAPRIRSSVRSGDTPPDERRRVLRDPPEIFITTPESLNVLLTSRSGTGLLHGLKTVILDEVHAVAGSKRGTHLITAVERLARRSGEFQRIALSATVRPLAEVAAWVGGSALRVVEGSPEYRSRPVRVIDASRAKPYEIEVCYRPPPEITPDIRFSEGSPVWHVLAREIAGRLGQNRSTLIFANSRQVVERMARLVNAEAGRQLTYSHHGSLSREIREVVEERLKAGELAGIVATSSLELGIDVGAIDEVLLLGTPPSIASTVQRLGRAGHSVGETSRGRLYAVHSQDLLNAAVAVRGVLDGAVEPIAPPEAPLDVLAQVILSMTALDPWSLDELYDFLRTAHPYRLLSRRLFDLVIEMLAGRYQGTRIPELRPRLAVDGISRTASARPGAARLIYSSGGTIPDRGYFRLRLSSSGALLGELDEEFVWERRIGETMTLGVQSWKIERITPSEVWVAPSRTSAAIAPFWRFDGLDMGFHLAELRARFLEEADRYLEETDSYREAEKRGGTGGPGSGPSEEFSGAVDERSGAPPGTEAHLFPASLARDRHLDPPAIEELLRFLRSQRSATGCRLPHRHHLVVEHVSDPQGTPRSVTILHTTWGGRINRPFALALAAALEERLGGSVETTQDDLCITLELPTPIQAAELLALVQPGGTETRLRRRLETSGFFGARFRANAGRALLLPRSGFGRRTPLWLSRQRAKELSAAVSRFPDFPILLETWRTCLRDEFDLVSLERLLDEVHAGEIAITEVETAAPSPFAVEAVWRRTNQLMYEDDAPPSGPSSLRADLIHEVAFSPQLRPRIPGELVAELEKKLQRLAPGYAPRDAAELIEWVKERRLVPGPEWLDLLEAMQRDHGVLREDLFGAIAERVVALRVPGPRGPAEVGEHPGDSERSESADSAPPPGRWLVCALEEIPRLRHALYPGAEIALSTASLEGSPVTPDVKALAERDSAAAEEPSSLQDVLLDWMRFYGPRTQSGICRALGVEEARIRPALEELCAEDLVVGDELTVEAGEAEACEAENLARLLRMARARARPAFVELPAEALPLFLAHLHDLGSRGREDALPGVLEKLFGYVAEAGLWEEEILPARLAGYRPSWLDALLSSSDLLWFGRPARKVGFALREEWDLVSADIRMEEDVAEEPVADEPAGEESAAGESAADKPATSSGSDSDPGEAARSGAERPHEVLRRIFPGTPGRFEFADLLSHSRTTDSAELARRLWDLTWSGLISNDGFAAVRRGVAGGFRAGGAPAAFRGGPGGLGLGSPGGPSFGRPGRTGRPDRPGPRLSRWRAERPFSGAWYRLPIGTEPEDALDAEELTRDRVRLLLDRYGVLFRELLERELPAWRWGAVFRSLRLMEFSGEVFAGRFFSGAHGLQFISPAALRMLQEGLPEDRIYWVNAADPASSCGLALRGLDLPRRVSTTHLSFRGRRLVAISERRGRSLTIRLEPDDPDLAACLGFLEHLLMRESRPMRAIVVEEINGEPAARSPYRSVLGTLFEAVAELRGLRLSRRYR